MYKSLKFSKTKLGVISSYHLKKDYLYKVILYLFNIITMFELIVIDGIPYVSKEISINVGDLVVEEDTYVYGYVEAIDDSGLHTLVRNMDAEAIIPTKNLKKLTFTLTNINKN